MPTIKNFKNFSVKIYYTDHNPPHFHVISAEYAAALIIEDLRILQGSLPKRTLRDVRRWAEMNRQLLEEKWREYNV
jgi:hypothetical protein